MLAGEAGVADEEGDVVEVEADLVGGVGLEVLPLRLGGGGGVGVGD